ncbi:GNAT family N-acetyltransferase [Ascidiaceihabitans sp.]|uniref:GNAT family N-acetyltransferase n=1 Tax=Ascidiaceihabitans sp. TaxID=1872644 RepID=UPI003299B59E
MNVTLYPLTSNDLPRVAHLRVAPDQIRFSGTVHEAFAAAEPRVDFHAIAVDTDTVGFFKIDRGYHKNYAFAGPSDVGLRAFLIDLHHQGKGLGAAACSALPAYLNAHYPNAKMLWLTVNMINPAAIRSYIKGGFTDTGDTWPHGDAGPQRIMQLSIC